MSIEIETPSHRNSTTRSGALDRVLDGIAELCVWVAGVMLVALIATFGWLVFGRYVLNNTPTWVEQTSLVLVVYITCLGAAAGVRYHSHLNIDFVRESFPPALRALMHHISDLFILIFGGFMAAQGWKLVMTNMERAIPMIGIPESFRAAPLVICGVLIMLFAGADIVQRLLSRNTQRT
ncbi:TRAP-type C4-dicarboxylate transport system permease small subunit [Vreelandella songnenensis]|uniref:TRAP transporter small permease protein n=1 Tax=Vreelandella songnenensis TaxID=1176243 RepID=A0A2T0V526_9GAMM|nr:TRAP transporter small permease [Halomonas songnenensis]PRY65271.1 TRAP-type C4-dicarboxylate transport system permease small subunit [Halomonas songnenensis]